MVNRKLDKFDLDAQMEVLHTPPGHPGAEQSLANIASMTGQLASKFGRLADDAYQREGYAEGVAAATNLDMPMPQFTFSDDGDYFAKVIGVESGGNPNAKNPLSSATGLGQFINSTWMELIGAHRPDLMQGRSQAQVLALRTDPNISREMLQHFTAQNTKYLKSQGITPSHGNLYLAHFLGNGGASSVIRANPNTPVSQLLTSGQISANKSILEGKTAGQVIAWSNKKMGSKVASIAPGGPLPALDLKGETTIRGRAFNDGATSIYLNRADIALRQNLNALAEQHSDSPAQMQQALEQYTEGYLADVNDPTMRAALLTAAERTSASLLSQSVAAHERMVAQEASAAFEEGLTQRNTSLFQAANRLPLTEAGDKILADEISAAELFIDNSNLTPDQKNKQKRALREGVTTERLLGAFEAKDTFAQKQAFYDELNKAWADGDKSVAGLSVGGFERLNGKLVSHLNAAKADLKRQTKAIEGNIGQVMNGLKDGASVPQELVEALKSQATLVGNPELDVQVSQLEKFNNWHESSRQLRPDQIQAQINVVQRQITEQGANPMNVKAIEVMEGLHDRAVKALKNDPLAWADATGVIEMTQLDFSSLDTMKASFAARTIEAKAAGDHFGVDVPLFRPHEVSVLTLNARRDPQFMGKFAVMVTQTLGEETPKALAQIADNAPILAHAAGLGHMTGNMALFDEISAFAEIKQDERYQPNMPKQKELNEVARSQFGGAFLALPKTQMAAVEFATQLFEGRAYARNIGADDFDQRNSAGRQLFAATLNEALGAEFRNGRQYGGIADINGTQTLLPPGQDAEAVRDALANFDEIDFATQQPIETTNGISIRPSQMSGAKLIAVGMGKYRVALGHPLSDNPQYVMTTGGGFFELDLAALLKSQQTRGAITNRVNDTISKIRPSGPTRNPLGSMFTPQIPVDQ